MTRFICGIAMLFTAGAANAATIGLHLASVHDRAGYNNTNPGVYMRTESGLTAGVYRNSVRRTSAYVGQTWETTGADWRAAVTLGAVTGYSAMAVAPIAMPSASWRVGGQFWVRAVYVPKPPRFGRASALHLAVEVGL